MSHEIASNDPYVLISADCHAGARIDGYRDYLEQKYLCLLYTSDAADE